MVGSIKTHDVDTASPYGQYHLVYKVSGMLVTHHPIGGHLHDNDTRSGIQIDTDSRQTFRAYSTD